MLRVANVKDEAALESVRDLLDVLGVHYEHIRFEPDEDTFPQTAYFYVRPPTSTCPTEPPTMSMPPSSGSPSSTASTPRCSEAGR